MTVKQSNYIKLAAITAMLIDHIGLIFFPEAVVFRIIGRIAFPLFAYQLSVGYINTRNFNRYFLRLFVFGLVLQLLYIIALFFLKTDFNLYRLNIFFTLTFGLLAIYFYDSKKYIYLLAIIAASPFINLDYGTYGISLILFLYIFRSRKLYIFLILSVLSTIFCCIGGSSIQLFSILSFFFIAMPLSVNINIPNKFFYFFYPLHLAVLYLLKIVLL